ncbi:MAG: 16S rRNA (uracil(1498)-N(3))-methyltransferase [Bacilli bacterium]|nr:16S rRNA (uracil(1498)-N(3))-methyltransferase [Bacilli bacterium]
MQRYFCVDKKDNYLELKDSDMHHIKNVMRMNIDDKIECIYGKKLYICKIVDLSSNKVEIINELTDNNELDVEITIAIGLVKEQKFDLIIQKLTELGVSKIIPLKMERSIVKLDDKKYNKKKERWQEICKEASEQSKRNIIPEITNIKTIKELAIDDYDLKIFGSTTIKDNLVNNYLQQDKKYAKIIAVIGPEGGITPKEEEILKELSFNPVSFGKRILRVETAAIYIASILNFNSMR